MTEQSPAGSMGGLGRSSAVMATGTAVSRVLGVVRNAMLIAVLGVNAAAANAFDVANKVPNILFMLLAGGVLNAVLVPQVVRAYRSETGQDYVDRLLTLAGTLLLGLTIVLTAGSSVLVSIYIQDWSPELTALAVAFGFWCIPQLFFYGLYSLLGQVLNARGVFGPYMWAPVLNNVVSIAGFAAFLILFGRYVPGGPTDDVAWWTGERIALVGGVATLGVAAQALVLIVPLHRSGFRYRPRWGFRGVGLGTAGRVATWTFAALVAGQLAYVVVSRVASAAAEVSGNDPAVAGNAAYTSAFLIYMLPHSLVTVSLATALFTRLSGSAADGDVRGVRADFSLGVRVVGVFTVFATAVVAVLALPATRLLLPTAQPAELVSVARVVVAMVAGLTAFGIWSLCQRVYYAFEDARPLFWIQAVMSVVLAGGTVLGAVLLEPRWWVVGVGVAMSASNVVGALVATLRLRGRLGRVDGARILRLHVQTGVAALVAAGAGWAVLRAAGDLPSSGWGRAAALCLVAGVLMLGVYLGLLRLMHVRELTDMLAPLRGRLRR